MTRYTQWCAVSHGHMLGPDPQGAWVRYADVAQRTCGTCRHYDPAHGFMVSVNTSMHERVYGCCTSRDSWHADRTMPPDEGCTNWEARDEEDGA